MDSRHGERLRWRSRRGLLELDILLTRYWSQGGARDAVEAQALEQLLELPDNDLLDLLMGRATQADPALEPVIARLKAA